MATAASSRCTSFKVGTRNSCGIKSLRKKAQTEKRARLVLRPAGGFEGGGEGRGDEEIFGEGGNEL